MSSAMILVISLPVQPRMIVLSIFCLLLFILPLFVCDDSATVYGNVYVFRTKCLQQLDSSFGFKELCKKQVENGLRTDGSDFNGNLSGLGVINIMEEGYNKTRPLSSIFNNSHDISHPTARRRAVKYTNRRFLDGEMCTKFDISIFQGPGSPLPNGIPTFSVQIFNLCTVGCPISNVHVACGWFASAKLVNPKVFRRLKFNDCLVNDGNPIPYGDSITFQYANSFSYQLRVETAVTWWERRSNSPANMLSPDQMVQRIRYTSRRFLAANLCTNKDISIFQGRDTSSGIPQYIVQIANTCMSDCAPSDIHVLCGWFASATLVNPNTFRRIGFNDCLVNGDVCTNKDISITQSRDGSVGIPQYTVQIVNTCMSECAPSDIHVYCGWFASSPPPNPNTFTRVAYNDCLVNGGRALPHGSVIQFQYANSFMYPLRFKFANFCR